MTCREFERIWDEFLDADARAASGPPDESRAAVDRERAMMEHAAGCAGCRQLAARYQLLRRAIRGLRPVPAPPAHLADRILPAAAERPRWSARSVGSGGDRGLRWRSVRGIGAVAAAALVIVLLLPRSAIDRRRPPAPTIGLGPAPGPDRSGQGTPAGSGAIPTGTAAIGQALAEATEATWELARSTTEPAARIGRQVIDAATGPEPNATGAAPGSGAEPAVNPARSVIAVPVPSLDRLALDPAAASELLQQVGDRLVEGVRPLSSTARQAFGFLLGPAAEKPGARVRTPSAKGA